MTVFAAYFDASGAPDDPTSHVLTVSGFIASAEQWQSFDRSWRKILARYGVKALHMRHFAHFHGEYEGWRNDKQKCIAFMSELVALIERKMRYSFASTIDLKDYRENDDKYHVRKVCSPYAIGGMAVTRNVLRAAEAMKVPKDHLLLMFEEGDIDKGNMEIWVRKVYGIKPRFEEKKHVKAFEACDLLAFEVFQATRKILPEPGIYALEDLRKSFQRLANIPHVVGGVDHWGMVHNPDMENSINKMFEMMPGLKPIADKEAQKKQKKAL